PPPPPPPPPPPDAMDHGHGNRSIAMAHLRPLWCVTGRRTSTEFMFCITERSPHEAHFHYRS
ncbi:MAG: hypothetical protein ACO4CG_15360, partial [Prochlorothrix sp.]